MMLLEKNSCFIFLCFISIIDIMEAKKRSRIIDRFGGFYRKDMNCKVLMCWDFKNTEKVPKKMLFITESIHRFNCTTVDSPDKEIYDVGHPSSNGSYDGVLGVIQRQEADVAPILVRPDGLPFEPGFIGPVAMEADVVIISRKKYGEQVTREILAFLRDFDQNVYLYFMIVIVYFCVIYTTFSQIHYSQSPDAEKNVAIEIQIAKDFFDNIGNSRNMLMGQENFSPKSDIQRILVLFFAIALLFSVQGIFLNKLGADLVAKTSPYNIDSIDYFVKNITHMKPIVIKKLYLLQVLKNSQKTEKLGKLWTLMEREEDETILDVDYRGYDQIDIPTQQTRLFKILQEIEDSKKALFLPRQMTELALAVGCTIKPDNVSRLHLGKESFAKGILTSIVSHGIDPRLRNIWDYFLRTVTETGLGIGEAIYMRRELPDLMPPGVDIKYDRDALDCMNGNPISSFKNSPHVELAQEYISQSVLEESFIPFNVIHMESCFLFFYIGILASAILCLFELVYSHVKICLFNRPAA
jgi:hypothetical protein